MLFSVVFRDYLWALAVLGARMQYRTFYPWAFGLRIAAVLLLLACFGCASNPQGSSWWLADTNKYDRYYGRLPPPGLKNGMSLEELQALFGPNMHAASAMGTSETYTVDR
jgi:hypothetical protein